MLFVFACECMRCVCVYASVRKSLTRTRTQNNVERYTSTYFILFYKYNSMLRRVRTIYFRSQIHNPISE